MLKFLCTPLEVIDKKIGKQKTILETKTVNVWN